MSEFRHGSTAQGRTARSPDQSSLLRSRARSRARARRSHRQDRDRVRTQRAAAPAAAAQRRRSQPTVIAWSDETLAKWHALGTRLNDIAHIMNARDGLPPGELLPLLAQLRTLFKKSFATLLADDAAACLRVGAARAPSPAQGRRQSRADREALRPARASRRRSLSCACSSASAQS